jgi:RNA polymerase sigma factor (sigma-70 family)
MVMDDCQRLLREYARSGSEAAFGELVKQYIDLVYSAAVRLLDGDAHLAKDVAQVVFADLARKAPTLSGEVLLGGWLHRHTCFVAANVRRSEHRRRSRERKAVEMSTLQDHSEENLAQVRPILDEAINELRAEDRTAIVLRFFEHYDFRSVGAALGSSENAAQKRVGRALEELRSLLKHRGVTLSAAVLGTALASEAVSAAPAGLAAAVCGGALTASVAGSGTTLTLLKFTAMTKLKVGILSAIVIAGVATPLVVQHQAQGRLRDKDTALLRQANRITQLEAENERLSNSVAQAKSTAALPSDPSHELLKLRSEVGMLREQTNELGRFRQENAKLLAQTAAQSDTNQVTEEDQLTLRKTHAVDAMNTLLTAVMHYATNHNGQYPRNFDQLAASGDLAVSNFAGNLGLRDFELATDDALGPSGRKVILRLSVPIQKPGGGGVMVVGGMSEDGVPHTEIWNVSP